MAVIAKIKLGTKVKTQKKAGKKKVAPSQKKSVKNGRHQVKQVLKKTSQKEIAKAVASIPDDLDGQVLDDEIENVSTTGGQGINEDLIDDSDEEKEDFDIEDVDEVFEAEDEEEEFDGHRP